MKRFRFHGSNARCTLGERELHCGDCFQLIEDGKTFNVRLEHSNTVDGCWLLIGVSPTAANRWDGTEAKEY